MQRNAINRKNPLLPPGRKIIAPSILSADFARLSSCVDAVGASPWIHIDVMDGRYVPNITVGPPVIASLRRHTKQYFDVHLMIEEPERHIEAFAQAGADGLTVHPDACRHLHRVLQQIRAAGMRSGVALNPAVGIDALEWVLDDVDLILVMTVNPGFGGQQFIPAMAAKVAAVRDLLLKRKSRAVIEVDGGVDKRTAPILAAAGAQVLVAGTAVFGHDDPQVALQELAEAITS